MKITSKDYRVQVGAEVNLHKWPTLAKPVYDSKKHYHVLLQEHVAQLSSLQQLLYESNQYAVLLIFQAMDAAGKDGAIKHVMSGVNPQGCQVFSFKHPSPTELQHDFLWRTTRNLPERGRIGIFNRSYYEEVLIARVHPEILRSEGIPSAPHDDRARRPARGQSMILNRFDRRRDDEIAAVRPASEVARLPELCSICPQGRIVAENLRELIEHQSAEIELRAEHIRDAERLREMDLEIRRQALFGRESDHRLMNDLQLVVSLLSLQSRTQPNAETATQLSVAANRVAAIARIHRHLHSLQGGQTIAFKRYLDELCEEYSTMLISGDGLAPPIVVEGPEIDLAAAIGTPLGLIANELITNAIKHGRGQVTVLLGPETGKGWALSVCNDGSMSPDGFDASARKGLGMSLVASLVEQIGGQLRIERGDHDQGARFTVLFSQ